MNLTESKEEVREVDGMIKLMYSFPLDDYKKDRAFDDKEIPNGMISELVSNKKYKSIMKRHFENKN